MDYYRHNVVAVKNLGVNILASSSVASTPPPPINKTDAISRSLPKLKTSDGNPRGISHGRFSSLLASHFFSFSRGKVIRFYNFLPSKQCFLVLVGWIWTWMQAVLRAVL